MRTFAGLWLACALGACAFEPSRLAGGPGPSPPPDAPGAADAAVPDASPITVPDASAPDAAPPAPLCDPEDPALVGCFAFEDTTDNASGVTLTVTGMAVGFDQGRSGRAAVFTAASELRIDSTSALDFTAVTIEMWVRPDTLPVAPIRAGLFDNDGQYSVFIVNGSSAQCLGSGNAEASGVLSAGTWTHVACVHDGGSITLYIDGQARDTNDAGPLTTGRRVDSLIGSDGPLGDERFIGRIDELRIWNRARTADEVCAAAGCTAPAAAASLPSR